MNCLAGQIKRCHRPSMRPRGQRFPTPVLNYSHYEKSAAKYKDKLALIQSQPSQTPFHCSTQCLAPASHFVVGSQSRSTDANGWVTCWWELTPQIQRLPTMPWNDKFVKWHAVTHVLIRSEWILLQQLNSESIFMINEYTLYYVVYVLCFFLSLIAEAFYIHFELEWINEFLRSVVSPLLWCGLSTSLQLQHT